MVADVNSETILKLLSVSRSFLNGDHEDRVLSSVSLELRTGDLCALVGRSGSGKSTLLNIIGLLDLSYDGNVEIVGAPTAGISQRSAARLRNRVLGFVFQQFHLIPHLTVLQNVALPLIYRRATSTERRAKAINQLERVGLAEKADMLPGNLSGGQRQRVAIARALIGDPLLLLADEPTGNLDDDTAAEVLKLLLDLTSSQKMACLVVTHDLAIAQRCGRRLTIENGNVTELVAA